jgi:hypothetical protein
MMFAKARADRHGVMTHNHVLQDILMRANA